MASMWWAQDNASETSKTNSELKDLFVFGYACKTFRDDEKAAYIDRGKHLIPWMGDDRLLIDRYDGRGHLYDLSAYDAENVKSEDCELSEKEQAVETACDEERYLELRTDIAEAELYQEEEWKRYYSAITDGYTAVGFSYEQPVADGGETSQQQKGAAESEDDQPFIVAPELQVPKGTDLPATKKQNAIIEKTAKFIAEHGAQMEIIIKTKQSGNPQFDFMHFEDRLNFYYRHMVKMIKAGKYKPKAPEVKQESYEDDEHHEHGYLHPSLNPNASAPPPSKPIKMPTVSVHETSYGQLIKSIKKSSAMSSENGSTASQGSSRDTPPLAPPPPPPFVSQPIYSSAHPGLPPPPGTEPVVLPQSEYVNHYPQGRDEVVRVKEEDDGGGRSTPNQIVPPPPDIQPIIDRMAMYVAKNGVEFEIVVKSKNDERFQFLHPWHMHFPYYDFKKQKFLKDVELERQEREDAAAAAANKAVSFSIKTRTKEPENNVTQLKKPLFDYDSSDNENDVESDSQKERTTEATSSSPAASESGQGSEVNIEVKQEPRMDIPVDERKMAEERLKDRLAAAAREKLAQTSKEKQMQAERKRKAAMFINLLKNKPTSADENSRDAAAESHPQSPRETPSNSRPSTPRVGASQERSIPRDPRDRDPRDRDPRDDREFSDFDRYDSFRRGWPMRDRSRSPHRGYRSRSRSPRIRYRSRSKSPMYQWRRRRSPTPPSAFSSVRRSRSRSPGRRSPARFGNIPSRRRSRSRSPRRVIPSSRSHPRSRSPRSISPSKKRSRSRDRKRKSKSPSKSKKRSRSKSPSSKHKKSKKSENRSPKKKKKKDKDKEKSSDRKKEKSKDKHKEKGSDKSKQKVDNRTPSVSVEIKTEKKDSGSDSSSSSEEDAGKENVSKVKGEGLTFADLPDVIEIDDNEVANIPEPPGPPPPPPPFPVEEEKPKSPSPEYDVQETTSGRDSPAVDDSKPPREVSKHLLSRVRALLKASRDEVMKEEDS